MQRRMNQPGGTPLHTSSRRHTRQKDFLSGRRSLNSASMRSASLTSAAERTPGTPNRIPTPNRPVSSSASRTSCRHVASRSPVDPRSSSRPGQQSLFPQGTKFVLRGCLVAAAVFSQLRRCARSQRLHQDECLRRCDVRVTFPIPLAPRLPGTQRRIPCSTHSYILSVRCSASHFHTFTFACGRGVLPRPRASQCVWVTSALRLSRSRAMSRGRRPLWLRGPCGCRAVAIRGISSP
jgi:hypothetical protein